MKKEGHSLPPLLYEYSPTSSISPTYEPVEPADAIMVQATRSVESSCSCSLRDTRAISALLRRSTGSQGHNRPARRSHDAVLTSYRIIKKGSSYLHDDGRLDALRLVSRRSTAFYADQRRARERVPCGEAV
jgi:hypothetical protein